MDSFWVGRTFVRPAAPSDAERVGNRLRKVDQKEALAVLGVGPVDAVLRSIANSLKAWTGEVDGAPYSCGGISSYAPGVACIWQLGTDDVAANARDYLRIGRIIVGAHCNEYDVVFNFISADNRASIRYVQALGFSVTNRKAIFRGQEFIYFERRRADVC